MGMRRVTASILLALAALSAARARGAATTPAPATPPPFKLLISHDTTRIDAPLLPDGTIDYDAAFRQKASQGITQDNNATPLIENLAAAWVAYPSSDSADQQTRLDDQQHIALSRPWKSDECPVVAAWLKANDKGLTSAADLLQKQHLGPKPPTSGSLPTLGLKYSAIRDLDRALVARALQRVAAGNQDAARQDLHTADHLASLTRNTPDALAFLVAHALAILNQNARLAAIRVSDAANAAKWLNENPPSPPSQTDADATDIGGRYQALSSLMQAIRGHDLPALESATGLDLQPLFTGEKSSAAIPPVGLSEVDWNTVLRHVNTIFDQESAIIREPDWTKRKAAAEQFSKDREAEKSPGDYFDNVLGLALSTASQPEANPQPSQALDMHADAFAKAASKISSSRQDGESRDVYSQRIAGLFTHLQRSFALIITSMTRSDARESVYLAAMALEVYQKQNGNYPEKLAMLAPRFLKEVSIDPFSGKELRFRREGAGYIVYSVGPDGVDDRGENTTGKDDVAVRSGD